MNLYAHLLLRSSALTSPKNKSVNPNQKSTIGCTFGLILSVLALIPTFVDAEENRFYGNQKFELNTLRRGESESYRGQFEINLYDKQSPLKFNIAAAERRKSDTTSRDGTSLFAAAAAYRFNQSGSLGVSFIEDGFENYNQYGYNQYGATYELNTEKNSINGDIIPYAYGTVGKRKINGGSSADRLYSFVGLKSRIREWGFFAGVDIEKYSWKDAGMSDSTIILFKPRVQYFLNGSDINAITLWGEFGSANERLASDRNIFTGGVTLDQLIHEDLKLNFTLYTTSNRFKDTRVQRETGATLAFIKYFN